MQLGRERRKEFRRHPDEVSRSPMGSADHTLPTTALQNMWSLCHRRPIAALNADNMLIPYSTELWPGCYRTNQTVPAQLHSVYTRLAKWPASGLDSFIPTEKCPWVRKIVVGRATRYGWTVRGSNPQRGNKLSLLHTVQDQPRGSLSLLY